jgi:hypothetical protein
MWLTIGEVVALAGLVLAGLNYWDNHHERVVAERERAQAPAPAPKVPALVLRGTVEGDGARIMLEPISSEQAIQTERYVFPSAILGHAKEIAAGRPQIDLGWFDDGLKRALKEARRAGASLPKGEAEMPMGVETAYVEGGEMRTDRALYRVGYVANPGLLGAIKLHLTGVSLVRRGVKGDLQAAVDSLWGTMALQPEPKPAAKPADAKPAA